MRKIISIIIILFAVTGSAFAQPEDAKIETIKGEKFYVHIVEQGNTLYGIHKLYNTSVEDILNANTGLSDDLEIGQRVLVPISLTNTDHFGFHIVEEGETLYGISKKYKCSVDDLKKINQGIENGIVPGQKIRIPIENNSDIEEKIQVDPVESPVQYQVAYFDSIVMHTVLSHETMYSISKRYMVSMDTIRALNNLKNNKIRKGDIIKIPIKKIKYSVIKKDINTIAADDSISVVTNTIIRKDVYSVALMLPFMLSKNDTEMSKPLKIGQIRELYPITKIAFEFYQGFIFAVDSLTHAGLKVNVYIYDTKNDTSRIKEFFKKDEFNNMDLVIGPMYNRTIELAAKECKERGISMVIPFKSDSRILHNNPSLYKVVTSNITLMDGVVDYLIENHAHHNILIFKPHTEKDKAIFERVRERFNRKIAEVDGAFNLKIIEINLGSKSGRDLNAFMRKDTANIVIIPSENVKFVSGAMLRLNSVVNLNPYAKKMRIVAFGLEDWNQFEDLDVLHRNKVNQHYATYRFVNYNKGRGLNFTKAYRNRYGIDPTVYSSQGFDIGLYFLGALHLYGTNFDSNLSNYQIDLIQNKFEFKPVAENSGRENSRIAIIMYQNYKLVPLN